MRVRPIIAVVAAAAIVGSCVKQLDRTTVSGSQAATLNGLSPYIKAHLRSGYVYVLNDWRIDSGGMVVSGRGVLLTPDRTVADSGRYVLRADSVALFESNVVVSSGGVAALSVVTGISLAVTTACIINRKACFGSCPTFYVSDGSGRYLQAEGFSSSIAPALEAVDVDALYRAHPTGRDFTLHSMNEALETHVIRYADVLVLARPEGGRVYQTQDGRFLGGTEPLAPSWCEAAEGDCAAALSQYDGRERSSTADSTDLATRETIELRFDRSSSADLGLVITARQSLMSTFLLYQGLAYLGSKAAETLAGLDRLPPEDRARVDGAARILGLIEVQVRDSAGRWRTAGEVGEAGPLAPDTKIVPLGVLPGAGVVDVRLRLTRGMWRIDMASLVRVGAALTPERLAPARVRRGGQPDTAALAELAGRSRPLTTLPGDQYDLDYRLPAHPEHYELFLETRGYYLEWMRKEWIAEENAMAAARFMIDPSGMLKHLAPAYKVKEPTMDSLFWSSRYARTLH